MKRLKIIDRELQGIKKAIDENMKELSKYLNIANAHGAIVGVDWQVIPSDAVPIEVYKQIDILGHKSQDLIKSRDEKWQELLTASDDEYKNQINRAKQLGIPEWYIERLKEVCSKTSHFNIIQAVEIMKNALDEV